MLAYIKGELAAVSEDTVVVETNGIGYELFVPATAIMNLPAVGSEIKIYTYLYVREDAVQLFGFITRDELDVFKLLITVSGIGPKGALAILSKVTPDELRIAVATDDVKAISAAQGIGAKTAGKLIIELKDKLKVKDVTAPGKVVESLAGVDASDVKMDVILALEALGYSSTEASRAVKQVEDAGGMDADALLSAALRKIMG
ncbi:MAG: Holliday junction branch migration protein RuvA [Lachnospiraceae bacterium]